LEAGLRPTVPNEARLLLLLADGVENVSAADVADSVRILVEEYSMENKALIELLQREEF
jgi:hypothetical protein